MCGYLRTGKSGKIQFVVPACSITEPFETLVRRDKERRALQNTLLKELDQLSRSQTYIANQDSYRSLAGLLITSIEENKTEIDKVLNQLLDSANYCDQSRYIEGSFDSKTTVWVVATRRVYLCLCHV